MRDLRQSLTCVQQEYTIVCRNKHRTRYADGSQLGMHANEKHLSLMEQVSGSSRLSQASSANELPLV